MDGNIYPFIFKNRFNRVLTEAYKINLMQVRFYFNEKLDEVEKLPTHGIKRRYLPVSVFGLFKKGCI